MTKLYFWDQLKAKLEANPDELAVVDIRPPAAIANPHINGGQPFENWEQLQAAIKLIIYSGPSHGGAGGNWNDAREGDWVWEIVGFGVDTGPNILYGFFIDETGELFNQTMAVARAWSTV